MVDKETERRIIQIIKEHNTIEHGITKTEVARIFSERWGTSYTTIWEYIFDLIETGKIELRKTKKKQSRLFLPE